jgi:hypothetical protein
LRSTTLIALVVLGLSGMPACAWAWGPSAHRIIAELAGNQLQADVRDEVERLLEGEADPSLAGIANWADEIRNDAPDSELARRTRRLHFVNFNNDGCRYDARRVCADGACAVAAIDTYAHVLTDRDRSDAERAEALRFLVHIVADLHQPLHAGYRADRGGNQHQVRIDGKGSNLHAVWDSKVLGSRRLGWRAHADRLARQRTWPGNGSAAAWAEQSCRLTRDGGIYPSSRTIDAAYLKRNLPLAEAQVGLAAARLAGLINRALGEGHTAGMHDSLDSPSR